MITNHSSSSNPTDQLECLHFLEHNLSALLTYLPCSKHSLNCNHQDQLDLMFSQLCDHCSLTELAILMPLVNTSSAEENYLTDGLSKIEPIKFVRWIHFHMIGKLKQERLGNLIIFFINFKMQSKKNCCFQNSSRNLLSFSFPISNEWVSLKCKLTQIIKYLDIAQWGI